MRIREVRIYGKALPVQGGAYRMASASVEHLDSTIVEIVADGGLSGWGETCPIGPVYQPHHTLGARAALQQLAPALLGAETGSVREIYRKMDAALTGHGYAKAALDIAIHDLLGKQLGVPVSALLGGALTDRVPSYYSTIVGEPAETARIALEKAREGYPRLQIKVGGRPVEQDIETIRKVWEAVGFSAKFVVDGNRGLTTADAITVDQMCASIPFVFEQPCNTMDEIVSLKGRMTHPVYLDENTEDLTAVLRAVSLGIADGFGFKITRLGGLSKMITARDICAVRSLPHSCDDAWGGDIIAAACVHLASTVDPRRLEGAWIAQEYISGNYDSENPVVIRKGHIAVPDRPGLGITPDQGVFGDPIAIFGG